MGTLFAGVLLIYVIGYLFTTSAKVFEENLASIMQSLGYLVIGLILVILLFLFSSSL